MRFLIVGTSGAGKSILTQALARAMARPYIELDQSIGALNGSQFHIQASKTRYGNPQSESAGWSTATIVSYAICYCLVRRMSSG
jgi:ABC-type glutathione transport system ATPase component